ncbi:MAG: zinc ribbon domain-containing protein [Candidatus Heimdallarchaeota archaeon]|nr:MAG: zinc ribbon domain-containing protein [Candidatus Heimdallarchaeota archaeon]
MVSKLMVAGIIVLILGGFLFVLFTLLFPMLGIALYPFYTTTGSQARNETISRNDRVQIDLTPGSPGIPRVLLPLLGVQLKASFYLQGVGGGWECDAVLVYNGDQDIDIDGTDRTFSGNTGGEGGRVLATIYTSINAGAASANYDLSVEIDNTGDSRISMLASRVDITYTLFAQIIPALLAIAGLVVTIVGVVTSRRPSVPKAKAAPGGWEPTLQWGGGAAAKQPKMAIKSTTAQPKKVKKVVKKAAPAGGAQQPCKFCGKPVPASAYFCPHCYGKLR